MPAKETAWEKWMLDTDSAPEPVRRLYREYEPFWVKQALLMVGAHRPMLTEGQIEACAADAERILITDARRRQEGVLNG